MYTDIHIIHIPQNLFFRHVKFSGSQYIPEVVYPSPLSTSKTQIWFSTYNSNSATKGRVHYKYVL